MALSFKRLFLIMILALTLLAGHFGLSFKMTTPTVQQQHLPGTQTHLLAVRTGCPPPPFSC